MIKKTSNNTVEIDIDTLDALRLTALELYDFFGECKIQFQKQGGIIKSNEDLLENLYNCNRNKLHIVKGGVK